MKICTICRLEKPLTDFNNKKQGNQGRASRCRLCTKKWEDCYWKNGGKEKKKEYRGANKKAESKRCKEWRKHNQHIVNHHRAIRRAQKLKATPKWLTKEHLEQIKVFYKSAKLLTKQTGIEYHVDHIYPLQGKTCSGLHVPWNLQVITKTENLSKHNKIPK